MCGTDDLAYRWWWTERYTHVSKADFSRFRNPFDDIFSDSGKTTDFLLNNFDSLIIEKYAKAHELANEISGFIEDFENLPKHIQKQLIKYAELLISKYQKGKKKNKNESSLTFNWENGLDELKSTYSSYTVLALHDTSVG